MPIGDYEMRKCENQIIISVIGHEEMGMSKMSINITNYIKDNMKQ